ncbi:MAG: hypothetical protein ACRD0Z_16650 [Acidimicrobiales bacterium]
MSSSRFALSNRSGSWRAATVVPAVLAAGLAAASITAVAAAAASSRPAASVPSGFRAASMSWLTASSALVLGTAPCKETTDGGSSIPTGCLYVVGTGNAGASWDFVAAVNAPLTGAVQSVTMTSPKVAWLYGPDLWLSKDSGKAWTKVPTPGGAPQVISLVSNATETYAMVAPCPPNIAGSCQAKPYTLWSTPTAAPGKWTEIKNNFTPPAGTIDFDSGLSLFGTTVYAFASFENSDGGDVHNVMKASENGGSFVAHSVPCDTTSQTPENLVQMVATTAKDVGALCESEPSVGQSLKPVFYSTNGGAKFVSAGAPETGGVNAQLAASPTRHLAVTSSSGASYIDVNYTGGSAWKRVVSEPDGGQGWNGIVYVSAKVAWVVYAPSSGPDPQAPGQLWKTTNGGISWSVVKW